MRIVDLGRDKGLVTDELLARLPKLQHEYEDAYFELGIREGGKLEDAVVTLTEPYGREKDDNNLTVRFTVKVIGFHDSRAPVRNWGARILKENT
jgi:hypothetical protein